MGSENLAVPEITGFLGIRWKWVAMGDWLPTGQSDPGGNRFSVEPLQVLGLP